MAGYIEENSSGVRTGTYLERFLDSVINIPPELQRKLNAIRDLDERVESLKSELAGKRDQCLKMEPHCSRNATPEQVAEAVKARDDMSAKQKLALHLASEKVRLAGEVSDLAASCWLRLDEDVNKYEEEIEEVRGSQQRFGPRMDVGLDLENGQWPEAETPSERLLEDWAERVKAMKPGDYVAARGGEKEEGQWILAQYSRWNTDHELFEVTDVDEEEQGREPLRLKMRDLVPLPKDGSSPYLEGTTVLAVYPSTTTFYRARVVQQPHYSSDGQPGEYRVEFEDDSEAGQPPQRAVEFKYVVVPPTFAYSS